MNVTIDRVLYLIFIVGAFLGGIQYESLMNDKDALKDLKNTQEIAHQQDVSVNAVAAKVMDSLSAWKQNTTTVTREIHSETTKPVFYNVCASPEYVGLWNSKQELSAKAIRGELSTEVLK